MLKRLALGGGALIVGGGLYAWQIEPHWVEVTRVTLPIHGLGRDFDGYRIAHISDLHTCSRVSTPYLRRCMDRINELNVDLIVVTGDLITGGLGDQIATAAGLLSRLRSTDGMIVCLGNHDYHRWAPGEIRFDVADRVTAAIRHIGARVLRNQSEVISRGRSRLTIIGLDELLVGRCDAKAAFAGVSAETPIIILSHNPDSMGILRHWPGDVVLSGHTHGGQVCIPFVGPLLLPVDNREYASGKVHVDGKTLYVNRGLGHLTKVRFNCRPEITVHYLR
jgi:predicted MPP superfamily phosphohydrolase